MKQTVEEAASENILFNHRTVDRTLSGKDLAKFGEMNFVQGAEWKSKQSLWISVKERLPEPNKEVLLYDKNSIRHYVIGWLRYETPNPEVDKIISELRAEATKRPQNMRKEEEIAYILKKADENCDHIEIRKILNVSNT